MPAGRCHCRSWRRSENTSEPQDLTTLEKTTPVYVALVGEKNYEWPECLSQNTIATPTNMDDFEL